MDLAPVRVNAVCPGLVLTDHVKQIPEAMLQSMVVPMLVPRGAAPAEAAKAAKAYVYLCSTAMRRAKSCPSMAAACWSDKPCQNGGGMVDDRVLE